MILETQLYRIFCDSVLGRFLDHSKKSADDDIDTKNKRIDILAAIWSNIYPSISFDNECWRREENYERTRRSKRLNSNSSSHSQQSHSPNYIWIFVKSLDGKTYQIKATPDFHINTVLRLLWMLQITSHDDVRVIYAGANLFDTLSYHKVQHESTLHLVDRLRGC